jgi:hypothetical protein
MAKDTGAPNGPKLTPGAILTEIPRFVVNQAMGTLRNWVAPKAAPSNAPPELSDPNAPQSAPINAELRRLNNGMRRERHEPWFGPSVPTNGVAPRGDVAGRARDYPVAVNLSLTPRQYESMTFPMLRGLFEGLDLAKLCVETRKNQMAKLSWEIMPRMKPGQNVRDRDDPRCAQLEAFFRSPDRIHNWDTWMRMLLHEMMVTDAPAVYVRRTLGGDIYSIEVVDGADIIPRIDALGRTPAPPEAAYTHILKGVPAINYTTDELIYFPRNLRAGRVYGQSPIELIGMTIQIAIRRDINKLQFWCYSDDTEVLTRRGWVNFDETKEDDEFATRAIGSGDFEWQRRTSSFKKHYTGDLLHIKGRSVDLRVTPHHRMLVCDRDGTNERVVLAEDLTKSGLKNIAIPVGSTWSGEEISEKRFVLRDVNDGRERPVVMSGDDYCAFMGMYLAEGNLHHKGSIAIAQPPDDRGSHDLYKTLMVKLFGDGVCYSGHQFEVCRTGLAQHLRQFGKAWEKFIPEEIKNATPRQIGIFFHYYYLGDGAAAADNTKKTKQITTVSQKLAADLAEIAQKIGLATSCWTRDAGERWVNDGNTRRAIAGRPCYMVSFRKAKPATISSVMPVAYDAPVLCVSVPNTFLYVRRNGKACWSGNTEGNIPDALIGTPADWTPDQINTMQLLFDSWTADQANRRKAYFIPGGTSFNPTRPTQTLDPQQDEWLARLITYAFNLPNLPLVNQQNRATSETANDAALREGLAPTIVWLKGFMDLLIQKVFGFPDIEWVMDNYQEEAPDALSARQLAEVAKGALSIDEYRAERGLPALGMKHAIFGIGPMGIMFVEDLLKAQAQGLLMPAAPPPPDAGAAAGSPYDAAPPGALPPPGPQGQPPDGPSNLLPFPSGAQARLKSAPPTSELGNVNLAELPPTLLNAVGLKPDYGKAARPVSKPPSKAGPPVVLDSLAQHESRFKKRQS